MNRVTPNQEFGIIFTEYPCGWDKLLICRRRTVWILFYGNAFCCFGDRKCKERVSCRRKKGGKEGLMAGSGQLQLTGDCDTVRGGGERSSWSRDSDGRKGGKKARDHPLMVLLRQFSWQKNLFYHHTSAQVKMDAYLQHEWRAPMSSLQESVHPLSHLSHGRVARSIVVTTLIHHLAASV